MYEALPPTPKAELRLVPPPPTIDFAPLPPAVDGASSVKEMLRLEILRQRIFAKNYWEKIGKEVPTRIKFSEE